MALKPGQEKCINTLDRSIVVAAGAGSGKTFTLTKRIVRAIETGAVDGIDRVCAITFTNKAAGELKSRIKSELRACGMHEQALKVDEAWVSTIHGMCARILRAHAIELDLDPKFKMADVPLAQRLQAKAVDDVLGMVDGGDDVADGAWPSREAVDALFAEYPARSNGPRSTSVESMLSTLMEVAARSVDGFDSFALQRFEVAPERVAYAVLEAYEGLAAAALAQKPNEAREAFAAEVEQRALEIRAGLEGRESIDALWVLESLDTLPVPKKSGTADYKEQVAEVLDFARSNIMELRLAAAYPHLETLVALAREASALFAEAKRAEGMLDNNDLLVLASRAVSDHPEIAMQYSDRFQLVMVDEFQDTDQMQVDMIKKLAGPDACRLCTVGDAQQSIYRFRGADVSVYRRHLETVRAGNPEDVILLPDNFRSHADVLAFVDRVFEQADMFGGEFMSLAPGRDESRVKKPFEDDLPRIRVQLTSKPYRGVTSDEAREVAADRIADVFAGLHERGHSAGEMAVLLGGMANADVYAAALRARGLACVIAGGSVFSQSPEAFIVLEMARVIANPYQTQSLFNVLTSPLFELDAGDLLQLATASDSSDGVLRRRNICSGLMACMREMRSDDHAGPCEARGPHSPKLDLAIRVVGALMESSGRSSVSRAIMRAAIDSGWISRLQAEGAEGLASAANIYKAIRMIDSIEADQASGPARTAALFQVLLEDSKEAPGALSASGGDFVRIMTVHASKGLEFPIVAVGEFKTPGGDSSKLLTADIGAQVALSLDLQVTASDYSGTAKLPSLPPLYAALMQGRVTEDELLAAAGDARSALDLRAALYEHDRIGDEEEAKRLLYVALTRAKEALVVSLLGTRTKDNPNGTPKNCMASVVSGLAGGSGGFDAGITHFEFGGSAPALVEHVALEAPAAGEASGESGGLAEDAVVDMEPGCCADGPAGPDSEMFAIPAEVARAAVSRTPCTLAHEGVFSYSSIAEASHEGDLLEGLAQRFCISVDEGDGSVAVVDFGDAGDDARPFGAGFEPGQRRLNRNAAVADEDDGSWSYAGSLCADADKATDLGTAFHRLAQYAVVTRGAEGALERPGADRIGALAAAGNLDEVQRMRLDRALARWFESDLARDMGLRRDLRAEVPFFVGVPADVRCEAYLEGEIDLLSIDGSQAVVVDYKTGGHADEAEDALRRKHVLQAACYAYAIMLQGVSAVEVVFVRVEQPRTGDGQPQCVRYRFSSDDVPVLESAIARAYLISIASPNEKNR